MSFYEIEFYSMLMLIYLMVVYALWVDAEVEGRDFHYAVQILLWPATLVCYAVYVYGGMLRMKLSDTLRKGIDELKLLWKSMDLDDEG